MLVQRSARPLSSRARTATFVIDAPAGSLLGGLVSAYVTQRYRGASVQYRDAATDVIIIGLPAHVEAGRVVVFASEPPVERIADELSSGRTSLLTIGSSSDEFGRALDALAEGYEPFIAGALLRVLALASMSRSSVPAAPERLTAREIEVLELVESGCSNREIASRLVVSPNTVRSHLQSASAKLGVTGRTRLALNARRLGLLSDPSMKSRAAWH